MAYKIIIYANDSITEYQKKQIIELKDKVWPHGYASQIKWINENLKSNDLHVCIYINGILVSYLDVVDISCDLEDGTSVQCKGLGNVCTLVEYRHMGLASALIHKVTSSVSSCVMLLCHDTMVDYYRSLGFRLISQTKPIFIESKQFCGNVMMYGCLDSDILKIDRSF